MTSAVAPPDASPIVALVSKRGPRCKAATDAFASRGDIRVLDVNLKGRRATAVAAAPQDRGVPFVLVTGYSDLQLKEPELKGRPRLDRPLDSQQLLRTLERAVQAGTQGSGSRADQRTP